MNQIIALVKARTREYYRDKGSLFWSFLVTPMIVVILAVSFSANDKPLLKAGVINFSNGQQLPFTDLNTVEVIPYENREAALARVSHHQLDIVVSGSSPLEFWINTESSKGQLMAKLLRNENPKALQQMPVNGVMIRYVDWVIPGILAMNMMFSGLWGIGYVIVRYRKNGVLKRMQATPISAWQFLAAQGISRLFIMLAVTSIVYFFCNLFLDFLMLGSYWLLLLLALAGNLSIISISLLMAARTASEELANGLLNLVSFPMLLLSEMWFSLDNAPDWVQFISNLLPLTHLVSAAREVMLEGAGFNEVLPQFLIMSITAGIFLVIASVSFRWDKDQ